MSALIRFDQVSLAFGDQLILREASLYIEPGERVCLIGRNGSGKSSTLGLLTGRLEPDDGDIDRPGDLRIGFLDQTLAESSAQTVREFVADGMRDHSRHIEAYEALAATEAPGKATLREMEALERVIEAGGGWSIATQVDSIITALDLPASDRMDELSGGWRRRVALAQAMVSQPDLLLLDEPTNHLDINTIEWLEHEVRFFAGAVLFVTHDRGFVDRVATRIIEIDRGRLRSWPGGYSDFLRQKAQADMEEDRRNAQFDKKLAEEEVWIRRGIKARESRNEGRVRALEIMREERAQRIARPRHARIHVNESDQLSGRKVIEVRNVSHAYGDKKLLDGFSLRVMRGERIGIIGNNGVGKTTLLHILLGELEPNSGSVKLGTHLKIAYFDQLRRELDTSRTVAEIVGEGRDYITVNGNKKHVVGYLTDFLFSAKRAMTRVSALSGGERNRVILAKLFTQAANLLVLDEPTNDLDVETLEALEARLVDYSGTLIVVSHDRHFLDRVVTSTLVFEADGVIKRYAGGYSDWARLRHQLAAPEDENPKHGSGSVKDIDEDKKPRKPPKKLSYKLQRELDALPGKIERLEEDLATKQAQINDPGFYEQSHDAVRDELHDLASLQRDLETAIDRWAELENMLIEPAQETPASDG
jgi:ATP-binding cassette subfamily F protein uup